jgi:hypothetical protein
VRCSRGFRREGRRRRSAAAAAHVFQTLDLRENAMDCDTHACASSSAGDRAASALLKFCPAAAVAMHVHAGFPKLEFFFSLHTPSSSSDPIHLLKFVYLDRVLLNI